MTIKVNNETNEITLNTGDSGNIEVTDLPTDESNYTLYFQVRDDKDIFVDGTPPSVETLGASSISIRIPTSYTNNIEVPAGQPSKVYYWALKLCKADGTEDTQYRAGDPIGTRYTLTAFPKQVEGTI